MAAVTAPRVLLFSYGTLQDKHVQLTTFGRELVGQPDAMLGYVLMLVAITDPQVVETSGKTHHPIVLSSANSNHEFPGMVFEIMAQELTCADEYEVSDFKRVEVTLNSGLLAWEYVQAQETIAV